MKTKIKFRNKSDKKRLLKSIKSLSFTISKSNVYIEKIKFKVEMSYEDEIACYFIGLPTELEIKHYIEVDDSDTLESCYDCLLDALELCNHPKSIKQLNKMLKMIDKYLEEKIVFFN